jgi:hypothetical protein
MRSKEQGPKSVEMQCVNIVILPSSTKAEDQGRKKQAETEAEDTYKSQPAHPKRSRKRSSSGMLNDINPKEEATMYITTFHFWDSGCLFGHPLTPLLTSLATYKPRDRDPLPSRVDPYAKLRFPILKRVDHFLPL